MDPPHHPDTWENVMDSFPSFHQVSWLSVQSFFCNVQEILLDCWELLILWRITDMMWWINSLCITQHWEKTHMIVLRLSCLVNPQKNSCRLITCWSEWPGHPGTNKALLSTMVLSCYLSVDCHLAVWQHEWVSHRHHLTKPLRTNSSSWLCIPPTSYIFIMFQTLLQTGRGCARIVHVHLLSAQL